jgi:hypothetical protein
MEHAKKFVLMDPAAYSRMQVPQNKVPCLDDEIKVILEGNEPDDVKAKHYSMVLRKYRVPDPVKQMEPAITEAEILDSVSINHRHKASTLLRAIRENPSMGWTERGELIYNQSVIIGSNIVELLNDMFKQRRVGEDQPVGWREFSEGLADSSIVNKDQVSNYGSWKVISEKRPPAKSVARPTTVGRRSRARGRSRSRASPRKTNWEEYS